MKRDDDFIRDLLLEAEADDTEIVQQLNLAYTRMQEQVQKVIIGQADVIDQVLIP